MKSHGRYRKVQTRLWADEKFRALSRPQPNAQTLWVFLICGPHTSNIPGLLRIGVAGLAEELEWPLDETMAALAEIDASGMARFDQGARLIYVPNALRHNTPESPNVVRSWHGAWADLPECDMKRRAAEDIKATLAGIGEGFLEAFREVMGEIRPKPQRKSQPKSQSETSGNQDQDQDQDQDQEQDQTQERERALSHARVPRNSPDTKKASGHRNHVLCGRLCLGKDQLDMFARHYGGPADEARRKVLAWAGDIVERATNGDMTDITIDKSQSKIWDGLFEDFAARVNLARRGVA